MAMPGMLSPHHPPPWKPRLSDWPLHSRVPWPSLGIGLLHQRPCMGFLFPHRTRGRASSPRPGLLRAGTVSLHSGPIGGSLSRHSLTLDLFLRVEGGSQGAHRACQHRLACRWLGKCWSEPAWLQAGEAPSQLPRRTSPLPSVRQRSLGLGETSRASSFLRGGTGWEAAARAEAGLDEALLAAGGWTRAGHPREVAEASPGSVRRTSSLLWEFVTPKRLP